MDISKANHINNEETPEVSENVLRIFASYELLKKFVTQDAKLTPGEIATIADYILRINNIKDAEKNFAVTINEDELRKALKNGFDGFFFSFFKFEPNQRWNLVYILKSGEAFLMNPYGDVPVEKLQNILKNFSFKTLKVNEKHVQFKGSDDFLALRHLKMWMKKFSPEFLKDFDNFEVAKEEDVKKFREETKNVFKKNVFHHFYQDLQTKPKYRQEVHDFVMHCHEYKELAKHAKNYKEILQKHSNVVLDKNNKEHQEIKKKIDIHRDAFVNHDSYKKITSKIPTHFHEEKKDYILKLQHDFKEEMETFTCTFGILHHSKNLKTVRKTLEIIATHMDTSYDVLNEFFDKKIDEEVKPDKPDDRRPAIAIDEIPVKEIMSPEIHHSIKTFERLISEVAIEWTEDKNSLDFWKNIDSDFQKYKKFANTWNTKNKNDIRRWSDSMKGNLKDSEFIEAVAVINRANSLVTGVNSLRDAQVISLLAFPYTDYRKNKLFEILPGEGKSFMALAMAVINILKGVIYVDIATVNAETAIKGAKDSKNFLGIFDITVGCVTTKDEINYQKRTEKSIKDNYKNDVVFGTLEEFQVDYLYDKFEETGIKGIRIHEYLILDEIDCLLLDSHAHLTKISKSFPGMASFKYIYIKIWQELENVEEDSKNSITKKLENKAKELKTQYKGDDEKLNEIYLEYKEGLIKQESDNFSERIKDRNLINNELIPPHLRDYATKKIDKWVENAIKAKHACHEGIEYVVNHYSTKENGVEVDEAIVVPVSDKNTGVFVNDIEWTDGMLQFVQIKHNLRITLENFDMCFVSNMDFLKLYGDRNYFGLTATLGSDSEYSHLKKAYNFCYVKIPAYRYTTYDEKEGVVVNDGNWADYVALDAFVRAKNNGSTFVICKTYNDVDRVNNSLSILKNHEKFDKMDIRTSCDDEEVHPCQVIVSTYLEARASKMMASDELEKNGGLHVCLGFLPKTKRIQNISFGKSNRNGQSGTKQIVAKSSDIIGLGGNLDKLFHLEFCNIEKFRDEKEKLLMDEMSETKLASVKSFDELFTQFANFYIGQKEKPEITQAKLKDIKEFWAVWVKELMSTNGAITKIFNDFERDIEAFLKPGKFKNPYYCVESAEKFLQAGEHDSAEEVLNIAMKSYPNDFDFYYTAHLKFFEVSIHKGNAIKNRLYTTLKKIVFIGYGESINEEYIEKSKDHIRKAEKRINFELKYLEDELASDEMKKTFGNRKLFRNFSENDKKSLPPLWTHLCSQRAILISYSQLVNHMKEELEKSNEAILKSRAPNYYRDLVPETDNEKVFKSIVKSTEFDEFDSIGLNVAYSVVEIMEIPNGVIIAAQAQIAIGIAAIAAGLAFPPSMVVMEPIASATISEGICDLLLNLVSQVEDKYDWKGYMIGKLIDYGVAILTLGIGIIVKVVKSLEFCIKLATNISHWIRGCKYISTIFKFAARAVEKLTENLIEKLGDLKSMGKLATEELLEKAVIEVSSSTINRLVTSFIDQNLLANAIGLILKYFKPFLKEQALKKVSHYCSKKSLRDIGIQQLKELLTLEIIEKNSEVLPEKLKYISTVLNNFNSVEVYAIADTLEILFSTLKLTTGIIATCKDLNSTIDHLKEILPNNDTFEGRKEFIASKIAAFMFNEIATLFSSMIYSPLANNFGELVTHIKARISPKIPKIRSGNSHEEEFVNGDKIDESYNELGLELGASDEQVVQKFQQFEASHPDVLSGYSEEFKKQMEAKNLLIDKSMKDKMNVHTLSEKPTDGQVKEAYTALGLNSNASFEEIQLKYGEKVHEFLENNSPEAIKAYEELEKSKNVILKSLDKEDIEVPYLKSNPTEDDYKKARTTLGLDENASVSEIESKFREKSADIEQSVNEQNEKYWKMVTAKKLLLSKMKSKEYTFVYKEEESSEDTLINRANIETLNDTLDVRTRIKVVKTNEEIEILEFGKSSTEEALEITYYEPSKNFEINTRSPHLKSFYHAFLRSYNTKYEKSKEKAVINAEIDAKEMAETPSFLNYSYDELNKVSSQLSKPLTRNLFLSNKGSVVSGGKISTKLMSLNNGYGRYSGGFDFNTAKIGNGTIDVYNQLVDHVTEFRANKNKLLDKNYDQYTYKKVSDIGVTIGVMNVELVDQNTNIIQSKKMWALSGDEKYSFDSEISVEIGNISGYEFVNFDFNSEDRKIFNLITKQPVKEGNEDLTYQTSCAAVKLSMELTKFLIKNPRLEVFNRYLAEVYFNSTDLEVSSTKINQFTLPNMLNVNCYHCAETLPYMFGLKC